MTETETKARQRWLAVGVILLCGGLWSTSGVFIKLLNRNGTGVPAVTIACYRALMGGALLLPMAWRRRATMREVPLGWRLGGVLSFALMTGCFVMATTRTAAANAIALQYTSPLWVFLLSPWLLGERSRWTDGVFLLIAMFGVAVIFLGHPLGVAAGLWIALVGGFGNGLAAILLRKMRAVHPIVVACTNFLGAGLLMLGAVAWGDPYHLTPHDWALLTTQTVLQFALPHTLFSYAVRHLEAQAASLIMMIEMVLNPLWVYLIIGEAVPHATFWGAPFILLGVAGWLVMSRRRGRTTQVLEPSDE